MPLSGSLITQALVTSEPVPLVMTFILQENLHSALAHLAHIGACRMDCVQLQLSSLTPLWAGHYFKPNNPVFVIACQKEENHVRDI